MGDFKVNPELFGISRLQDGELCLTCGDLGMETDLVFASGAFVDGDPLLETQKKILEFILDLVNKEAKGVSNGL